MSKTMQQAIADLTAQVAANTSAEASAVTAIQGLAAQISQANQSGDPDAVEALVAQLNSSASALGAAIVANTPATASPAPAPSAPSSTPAPSTPPTS